MVDCIVRLWAGCCECLNRSCACFVMCANSSESKPSYTLMCRKQADVGASSKVRYGLLGGVFAIYAGQLLLEWWRRMRVTVFDQK